MSRNAAIVLMLCVAVAVSSCRNRSKQPTDTVSSGVIKISADESFRPLIQQEIDVFEGLYPAAGIIPEYTSEVEAINLLIKDSVRLAVSTRKLTQPEINTLNEKKLFPKEIKIATDGIALITNKQNTDSMLSLPNLTKILTGKITKWKELDPQSKLGDIQVVFDNANSSTVRYAIDSLCGGAPLYEGLSAQGNNPQVIDYVANPEKTAADIKNADAIVVSVGGNDFFHRKDIMIDALKNALLHGEGFFPQEVTNIYDEYEKNLSRIIDEIKNMNPDAYIIVQTVYNPFLKQTLNFSYINVGKTANRYVTRLNDSIKNVCKTKNRVFVFDVAPEMNEDAENFYGTDEKLDIHPTKHGHATLARVFTEKFNGLLKD